MDAGIQNHTEHFVHDISNPSASGLCSEMLEVAEEACRAGDFDLAVEIYSSQLADLQQPDRGLCLRKADALARGGRIAEALDSYCIAANIHRFKPEELKLLVENIARTIRVKGLIESKHFTGEGRTKPSGNGGICSDGDEFDTNQPLDPFSCRLCNCLLLEPTTLVCGHTFCKRCLEDEDAVVNDCICCRCKINKCSSQTNTNGFRINVVLSGVLEKWFHVESTSRRYWLEGERLWKTQDLFSALEKYDKAVELELMLLKRILGRLQQTSVKHIVSSPAPSICRLLSERAKLHMDMKNFSLAVQDADSLCQLCPSSAKVTTTSLSWLKKRDLTEAQRELNLPTSAHYIKAKALCSSHRREEALQEYFYCVALKPDWTAVKMEAQKDSLVTPLHPHQGTGLSSRIKPSSLLSSLHSSLPRDGARAGCSKDPTLSSKAAHCGSSSSLKQTENSVEESKNLAAVLSSLPVPPGLKRKCPVDAGALGPPSKLLKQDPACSSLTPPVLCRMREVPHELLDSADMECSLCMRLFYEPVTTPCGHTFCLKCLERCLDHNPNCPLCKENLSEYLANRGYNKTFLMEEVLQRYLREELEERRKVHEEELKELSNLNQEVPIFVCTMAFPTIPCPLHVFEPRYRLMIRRAIETGTKQFGMCISDEVKGFADYGCMLEVRDVKFFPDGRSVVDTIGVARFKVLSHGQRDGYNTAKIEYLQDKKAEGEELGDLLKLHDSVYEQATAWFTSLKDNMKSQILSHFGHLPSKDPDPQGNPSGPAWCWWLLAVLPLESKAQLTILSMTSLKERLVAIRRVLIFVTRKRPR
ncbi:LON peptidase N-terminal domain and RING finger protein 2 isoform X2 [Electrophorus electricus]|uniref:LON peptidase N-terminal domain and RING finger protein 2 isoform X2 n=1 Tax=Electrophorus electricus TaxID=8005 RepID=UPI0015CFE403|nr:LON peptidase N-terminal domain and RING finger protein 2 isoform X2 [Electrophorus electricus]